MLRYLATTALPPGQPVNEELIASIAPMLDQVGSVFGEVRDAQLAARHAECSPGIWPARLTAL
jgi:hypothetical protein